MRVAITGGTGFVGPAVVQAVLDQGHEVRVLEHHRPCEVPDQARLTRVSGDVLDDSALDRLMAEADAVIHLVAIIREKPSKGITFARLHTEATRRAVDAAKRHSARRFILMSANGVESDIDTGYYRTKREMEDLVTQSGLEWTIFRPSYIAGDRPDGFDDRFARVVDKLPLLPDFAGGQFEIQPVALSDVARAFAKSVAMPASVGETYVLVGPERMTWHDYLTRLKAVRGRKRIVIPAPGWAVKTAASLLGSAFPASRDQLTMMFAGNVGDPRPAAEAFGLDLVRWEDAVAGLRRD